MHLFRPNVDSNRKDLGDELLGLCSWWNLPLCIVGDFNITWFRSERSREAWQSLAMNGFSDF